jgi:hypothetical protein
MENKQPKNIFEQIVFGQEILNENIVALSENLDFINQKVDMLIAVLSTPPIIKDSEPNASGAGTKEQ